MGSIIQGMHFPREIVDSDADAIWLISSCLDDATQLALTAARQQLLVSLDALIQADQHRLGVQLAGLQYDITRLADQRTARAAQ